MYSRMSNMHTFSLLELHGLRLPMVSSSPTENIVSVDTASHLYDVHACTEDKTINSTLTLTLAGA